MKKGGLFCSYFNFKIMAKTKETKTAKKKDNSEDSGLKEQFTSILQTTLWLEEQLVEKLPVMEKAATTEALADAFEDHYLQTRKHVSRLRKIFKKLDITPKPEKLDAFQKILEEGEACIKSTKEGSMLRDALLIFSAQKVEHYEIAVYGTLVAMAHTLDCPEIADILDKTLQEEEETDKDLTSIAESHINFEASQEEEE